jgi:hypothetical protein
MEYPSQYKNISKEMLMKERASGKHYEEKFAFPLWTLIKQRAEEKDISYHDAMLEVVPEYEKSIRYGDTQFEQEQLQKRRAEQLALSERERRLQRIHEGD